MAPSSLSLKLPAAERGQKPIHPKQKSLCGRGQRHGRKAPVTRRGDSKMPTIGSFQMQSQLRRQLCWAAVAVSVNSFRVAGATDSQCDVTQTVLGPFLPAGTDCCANL